MTDPEREGIFSSEFLTNPFNLANLRHVASLDVQANHQKATYWVDHGILSPMEAKLCTTNGLVVPSPYIPTRLSTNVDRLKLIDHKVFPHFVDLSLVNDNPIFFVDGTFELVHCGHLLLLEQAIDLAANAKPKLGNVFLTIQSNKYIERAKGRSPLFPEVVRAGWFRDENIYKTVIWPTFEEWAYEESWNTGLEWLDQGVGMRDNLTPFTMGEGKREMINFVYNSPHQSGMSAEESESLLKRINQVKEFGFGVHLVDSQVDISTSELIKRFKIKPSSEFYLSP